MNVPDVEQRHRIEFRRPGITRCPIVLEKLQQATPIRMPVLAECEDVCKTPLFVRVGIAMPRQELARREARVQRVGAHEFIVARYSTDEGQHFLTVQVLENAVQKLHLLMTRVIEFV